MATRADFWIGTGNTAEWLGSVAFDGYEWADDATCPLRQATDEEAYRSAVAEILGGRDDATVPSHGWPWPWNTSATTDYAYYFDGETKSDDRDDWPDMSAVRNAAMGTKRDSIMIIGANTRNQADKPA